MIEISLIPPDHVLRVWEAAKPHLAKVIPYTAGRYTVNDILTECVYGIQSLWIVFESASFIQKPPIIGAFTTRINIYPRRKTLNLQFCGGTRMKEWASKANDILERFAKDNGCDALEMTGREGWCRILAPLGWKPIFRVYERSINDIGK